nr:reverse transcriptase domain-containing protein [Tanacetum cinerariifolium]
MRTRSSTRNRSQQQVTPNIEPFDLEEHIENQDPPVVMMADTRTMVQLLQAPTESYEDAIVVPAITAKNFELKHGLLTLVQNKQFFGHDKEDPHAHIRYFNKITSKLKFPNVPNTKAIVAKVSTSTSTPGVSPDVAELKDMVKALLLDKKNQSQAPATVKAVEKSCEKLNLSDLTKTRMILELADRTISTPTGIAEDVFVKVGTFFFSAVFVIVDYITDPWVPLILGRPFLRTARALIDVHGEQMTLRHDDQSITFKVGDTKTFSYNIIESVNRVDVIDVVCEEFAQEVLGFSNISKSGNLTPTLEPIISTSPTSFTPFSVGDFILKKSRLAFQATQFHWELMIPTDSIICH